VNVIDGAWARRLVAVQVKKFCVGQGTHKRCDGINQYLERYVMHEEQISTAMQKKGTAEKGERMPRSYPEKLIKRSESMADMLPQDDCFRSPGIWIDFSTQISDLVRFTYNEKTTSHGMLWPALIIPKE
jgi:hypothetical protein